MMDEYLKPMPPEDRLWTGEIGWVRISNDTKYNPAAPGLRLRLKLLYYKIRRWLRPNEPVVTWSMWARVDDELGIVVDVRISDQPLDK